jgi:hypothetical protein
MVTINCLRSEYVVNGKVHPVFVGFSTAGELSTVCSVPAFEAATQQDAIARSILNKPVREWQRPPDLARIDAIKTVFNSSGELMPNPVLLIRNPDAPVDIGLSDVTHNGKPDGLRTGIYQIVVAPVSGAASPLWILDGQHRIRGLAQSNQADSPLPVVILLDQGQDAYSGHQAAKIFAQVTTEAAPLRELHRKWLTYAFEMKEFKVANSIERRAMETVAHLCSTTLFRGSDGSEVQNGFFNKIQFNDYTPGSPQWPASGGFRYNCNELYDIVLEGYWNRQKTKALQPLDLAQQMAFAHDALTQVVTNPSKSVFFSNEKQVGHKVMQEAFWFGVFSRLVTNGASTQKEWVSFLTGLNFRGVGMWDFSWVLTMNGTEGTLSKAIAIKVFDKIFKAGAVSEPNFNWGDWLKGNNAQVRFTFSNLTPAGNKSPKGAKMYELANGNDLSLPTEGRVHVQILSLTDNIGKVEIIDGSSTVHEPLKYSGKGFVLDPKTHSNPLKVTVKMYCYGGITKTAKASIVW